MPASSSWSAMVSPYGMRGSDRFHAIDIGQGDKGAVSFIPSIHGRCLSVFAGAGDGAEVAGIDRDGRVAAAIVGVYHAAGNVRRARPAAPIGSIVAADREIRAADDFQIVGEARMCRLQNNWLPG